MTDDLSPLGAIPANLAELLSRQGGVVTSGQAVASMSRATVRWGLERGVLVSLRRGVLTTSEVRAAFDPLMLDTRAALLLHPDAVASHLTAARLQGLETWIDRERSDRPPETAIWLTRDPRRGQRWVDRNDLQIRPATLRAADVRHGRALPSPQSPAVGDRVDPRLDVTVAARTVVDLGRELPFREALVTADSALAGGVDPASVHACLASQAGWPGIEAARRVVECADGRAESALESISRATVIDGGLPTPLVNVWPGHPGDGLGVRTDLLWSRFWVIGESDGLAKYDDRDPAVRRRKLRLAKEREERLEDYGFQVVRFGWEDAVLRFDELCARFRRAMARGRNTYDERGPTPYFVR